MRSEVPNSAIGVPSYILLRDQLRENIISGKIPAGARLLPVEIARRFGVSQTPVRGALQQLEGEGLITIFPHREARVRLFDEHFVRNICDLWGVIEGLMARLSIPRLTPAVMEKLNDISECLRIAIESGDMSSRLSLNQEFHRTIYVLSENSEALGIFEKYLGLIEALHNRYGFHPQRGPKILEDHAAILKALHSQDTALVEELVRLHCEGARDDLLACMSESKDT